MAEYHISHITPGSSATPEVGIVIPVYNRHFLVKLFLRSLAKSHLKDTVIAFVNDASEDERVVNAIKNFKHKDAKVILFDRQQRKEGGLLNGLHHNLQFTAEYLFGEANCKYVSILDSDSLVRTNWLTKTLALYKEQENSEPLIVSGFNTINQEVSNSHKDFHQKKLLGGINMLFNRATFAQVFVPLPAYWDEYVIARMNSKGYPILCTRPSVVQHTGVMGTFSYLWRFDFAHDYWRPHFLWLMLFKLHRGFYRFMLLINDNIRHPLKKYFKQRREIS